MTSKNYDLVAGATVEAVGDGNHCCVLNNTDNVLLVGANEDNVLQLPAGASVCIPDCGGEVLLLDALGSGTVSVMFSDYAENFFKAAPAASSGTSGGGSAVVTGKSLHVDLLHNPYFRICNVYQFRYMAQLPDFSDDSVITPEQMLLDRWYVGISDGAAGNGMVRVNMDVDQAAAKYGLSQYMEVITTSWGSGSLPLQYTQIIYPELDWDAELYNRLHNLQDIRLWCLCDFDGINATTSRVNVRLYADDMGTAAANLDGDPTAECAYDIDWVEAVQREDGCFIAELTLNASKGCPSDIARLRIDVILADGTTAGVPVTADIHLIVQDNAEDMNDVIAPAYDINADKRYCQSLLAQDAANLTTHYIPSYVLSLNISALNLSAPTTGHSVNSPDAPCQVPMLYL